MVTAASALRGGDSGESQRDAHPLETAGLFLGIRDCGLHFDAEIAERSPPQPAGTVRADAEVQTRGGCGGGDHWAMRDHTWLVNTGENQRLFSSTHYRTDFREVAGV